MRTLYGNLGAKLNTHLFDEKIVFISFKTNRNHQRYSVIFISIGWLCYGSCIVYGWQKKKNKNNDDIIFHFLFLFISSTLTAAGLCFLLLQKFHIHFFFFFVAFLSLLWRCLFSSTRNFPRRFMRFCKVFFFNGGRHVARQKAIKPSTHIYIY